MCLHRAQVDLDRVADVLRVAAGERNARGDACLGERVANDLVPLAEAALRQREAAEPVPLVRVGAGEHEADLRSRARQRDWENRSELGEVWVVARAVRKLDVDVAGHPAKRIVAKAVHGERERVGVCSQQRVRAVALVDVDVDDEHPPGAAGRAEVSDRSDDVVEDAEAATGVRERVVGAAAEVHRDAVRRALRAPPRSSHPSRGVSARRARVTTAGPVPASRGARAGRPGHDRPSRRCACAGAGPTPAAADDSTSTPASPPRPRAPSGTWRAGSDAPRGSGYV